MMIDVSEYIDLLGGVIRKMNIPSYLADEAFSEGLVALTKAAQKYRPEEDVPVEAWLRKYVRWELLNWQAREYKHNTSEIQEWDESPMIPVELNAEKRAFMNEVILATEQLEPVEKMALLGSFYGLNHAEVCVEVKRMTGFGHPNVVQYIAAQARSKVANIINIRQVLDSGITAYVKPTEGEQPVAIAGKTKKEAKAEEQATKAPATKATGPKTRGGNRQPAAQAAPAPAAEPKTKATKAATPQATKAHEKAEDTLCVKMQKDGTTRCKMPHLKGVDTCYNHTPDEELVKLGHKPRAK